MGLLERASKQECDCQFSDGVLVHVDTDELGEVCEHVVLPQERRTRMM